MIHLDLINLLSNWLYTQSLTQANISSNKPAYAAAIRTYGLLLQELTCLLLSAKAFRASRF